MLIRELFIGTDIEAIHGISLNTNISGIASDSREVTRGCLFVCIKGRKHDGHEYISQALSGGADAVVVEDGFNVPCGVPYISVRDT